MFISIHTLISVLNTSYVIFIFIFISKFLFECICEFIRIYIHVLIY